MIVYFPCDPSFDSDVQFFRRSDGISAGEWSAFQQGDNPLVRGADIALFDGDYYLVLTSPNTLFCCRIENQVATIADFWPQLDMLRAMQAGKAYNWTNQANEVLRVAIEEAS